ncbi:MAG: thioredoxin family protein [Bacteroidia bacterium]|nr:thioredoxin family protein [Bacteroidia bacterium]
MNQSISRKTIEQAYSYAAYKELIKKLVSEKKSTGPDQSEQMIDYTKLNLQRLERSEKTFEPTEETISFFKSITIPQNWVLISESWCGDASQNVAPIALLAALNPLIKLNIILRDENESVINNYLTNGGKAIPKLIVLDNDLNEIMIWGPRPALAQEILIEHKKNPNESKEEFHRKLQLWYAQNRGAETARELTESLKKVLIPI